MTYKTITYTDYNDVERTETFWFHLSKAELTEMEMSTVGGLSAYVRRITEAQDAPTIIRLFKDLILKAYGEKSPDGRRFIKSPELSEQFAQTEAYSELFMELSTNADAAAAFVNGIVPADVAAKMAEEPNKSALTIVE